MIRRAAVIAAIVTLAAGCGTGAEPAISMDQNAVDLGEADTVAEVAVAEVTPLDLVEAVDLVAVEVEVLDLGWQPEPGEAGYPCESGADCNEGFCIQTPDGMQCTETCEEECPVDAISEGQ